MKHFRRLLPALCLLLISAMCAGTSTYAWFSLNNTVTANGLVIKAESHGTLVIDDKPLTTSSSGTSVDFTTTTDYSLRPCTAVASTPSEGYKLMTLKSTLDKYIDASTGIYNGKDGHVGTPTDYTNDFDDATEPGCYVERTVYIGTQGQDGDAINSVTLTMSIGTVSSTQRAVSILVRIDGGKWENYCLGSGDQTVSTSAPLISATEDGTKIDFRIYFDGSLADPDASGTTIVHTNGATLNDVTLNLSFDGTAN